METGRTVVLLNLENLYESLYDALNQVCSIAFCIAFDCSSKIENRFYFFSLGTGFRIYFLLSLSSRKLHKHYQMLDKINSHICLMFIVYKTFHETVNYGHQRYQML